MNKIIFVLQKWWTFQVIKKIITVIISKIERKEQERYSGAMSPEMIGRPEQRSTRNPATGVDVTGTDDNDDIDSGTIADLKADASSSDIGKYSANGSIDDTEDDITAAIDKDERRAEIERKKEEMRAGSKELGLEPDMVDDELADDEQAINKALTDTGLTDDDEESLTTDDPEKIKQEQERIRKENIRKLAKKGKSEFDKGLASRFKKENL